MKCMKCAKRIAVGQVFCADCLTDMEKHPINPDTPVVLPPRAYSNATKRAAAHRKSKRPEEQMAAMRAWIATLTVMVVALLLAFAMSVTLLLRVVEEQGNTASAGQNYSTGAVANQLEP